MLQKSETASDTSLTIDHDTHAIVLKRVFAAPREHVFEAWTKPEHVAFWWDPAGHPLAVCEIDLRPGGAFKFVDRHPSGAHTFSGVYREISPPHGLTFEAMGAIGRVILEETAGNTHLTVRIECGSAAGLEQFLKMGVAAGTAQTLDNLVAYVRTKPQWQ